MRRFSPAEHQPGHRSRTRGWRYSPALARSEQGVNGNRRVHRRYVFGQPLAIRGGHRRCFEHHRCSRSSRFRKSRLRANRRASSKKSPSSVPRIDPSEGTDETEYAHRDARTRGHGQRHTNPETRTTRAPVSGKRSDQPNDKDASKALSIVPEKLTVVSDQDHHRSHSYLRTYSTEGLKAGINSPRASLRLH